jgi:UDP-GlcNAc3NAcA epimerase
MGMKKIVTVLGARPQFIKAAVVSRHLAQTSGVTECIVHTGQHFDANMSDIFFDEMEIPKPDYNLNIHGLSHGAMTGQMLEKVEGVLHSEKPDMVLVYGDTNSTLAGALAAKKIHIPVTHVEAGLRSFNIRMPEEINRILTDRISDLLFCPTDSAMENLRQEGYDQLDTQMFRVGDVMLDASRFYSIKARKPAINLPDAYILCTLHRGENTDNPVVLKSLMQGLEQLSREKQVVMPIHPRTRQKLQQLSYDLDKSPLLFLDPVGYFEMIYLIIHAYCIVTDSGGLQKEAFFFGKNCLVTREETEWTELVNGGFNFICGSNPTVLMSRYQELANLKQIDFSMPLYGDGNAGGAIVTKLMKFMHE